MSLRINGRRLDNLGWGLRADAQADRPLSMASSVRSCRGRGTIATHYRRESLTTNEDGLVDLRRQNALKRPSGNGCGKTTGYQAHKGAQSRPDASMHAQSVSGKIVGLARRTEPHCGSLASIWDGRITLPDKSSLSSLSAGQPWPASVACVRARPRCRPADSMPVPFSMAPRNSTSMVAATAHTHPRSRATAEWRILT